MATERQKKLVKKVIENRGNVSKSMREVGYSAESAKNPQQVTGSKGWKELMDQFLPEDRLAQLHEELLNAHSLDQMVFPLKMTDAEIKELLLSVNCKLRKVKHGEQMNHAYFWAPNEKARIDALDMAYKLRGNYAAQKVEINKKLSDMSDEELNQLIEEESKKIQK